MSSASLTPTVEATKQAYDNPHPFSMYVVLVCFQMVTSLWSVIGSVVILRIATPKLGSTYQRFLFMLSTAITINCIFVFLHPLLVPHGTTAWGMGNDQTCSVVGFFLVYGSLMVSMYHNALALYFYFSIQPNDANNNSNNNEKRIRQPEDVVGWPEFFCNVCCWIVPGTIAGVGAGLQSYNFDPKADMCVLYDECDPTNEINGDCIPMEFDNNDGRYGTSGTMILRSVYQWLLVASGLISVLVMGKIQCQTRRAMNTSRIAAEQMANDELDLDGADEQQQIVQKLAAVSTQCVLYIMSYLTSYVWFIALIFIPPNNSNLLDAFLLLTAFLYPIIGVFNCIVYIRPRVQMLQIMYPQDPFVVVVRVAMSKAGDPGEIEMIREEIYGSEYSGSDGHPDSDDRMSRDSAIPSVVHFDPNEKPLSIKSLVSTPGEEGDEMHNNKAEMHSHKARMLTHIGEVDPDDSLSQ